VRPADSQFDLEEIVTLYGHGPMTLRTAIERVLAKDLCGFGFNDQGKPSILGKRREENDKGRYGY
jgi:hypothetical protein